MPPVTDSEPDPDAAPAAEPDRPAETPEEKRARVMNRLAEMIRADPPDFSSAPGPVSPGAFPDLPENADEFDQQAADQLFAALSQFFELRRKPGDSQDLEKE